MIHLDSEIELNKLRSNINIDKVNIRKIYDRSIKYAYGKNKPLEIKECVIMKNMVNHIRHSYSNYEKSLKVIRKINDIEQTQYKIYKNNESYSAPLFDNLFDFLH